MQIKAVPIEWVNRTWRDAARFIADALAHSKGDYTIEQAQALVSTGQWALLVAVEDSAILGAATVSFYNRLNDRVALVTAIGGRMITTPDTFKQLKIFAESHGATVIESAARDSMARLLHRYGFEDKYRIVEVRL